MQEVISRKVALERGLSRYFTGKPCVNGHKAERNVRSHDCVECNRARQTVKTPFDSLKRREKNLSDRYGISIEDFAKLVEQQANRCAICRNLTKRLMVDHCHDSERVRELLCQKCNSILGLADDQIEILQAAIDYLIKHS